MSALWAGFDYGIAYKLAFAAIGSSWNLSLILNNTDAALSHYGKIFYFEIFALLHQYLYDEGNPYITRSMYENIMSSAPPCGPYYKPSDAPTDIGVEGWRSIKRWERSRWRNTGSTKTGRYTGLDYMILHNLYWLVNYGDDVHVEPNDFRNGFSKEYKENLEIPCDFETYAFDDMLLACNITPDNEDCPHTATFKAGNQIDFTPGFECSGATVTFSADYVPDCATNQLKSNRPNHIPTPETEQNEQAISVDSTQKKQNNYIPLEDYLKKDGVDLYNQKQFAMQIFPNPADENIQLLIRSETQGKANIQITNSSGMVVKKEGISLNKGQNIQNISVPHLAPGFYIIQFNGENMTVSKTFIKNNENE